MILLAQKLQEQGHDVSLWCLRETGPFVSQVKEMGIPLKSLEKVGRYDLLKPALRLWRWCRQGAPDVLICCLPSANLYGLVTKLPGVKTKLLWGLASAKLPVGEYGLWAKASYWVQAKLARIADSVVVNSVAGFESAIEEGYPKSRLEVIHNGIDTKGFQYNEAKGRKWREKMNIPQDATLVGMAGRLDPAKNYEVFLKVCGQVHEKRKDIWFAIVGGGTNDYANDLRDKIHQHPLYQQRLVHLENETDMQSAYSAFDIMTLTSKSEGLPNTIVEAMSCGRFCVVTDVGDCKLAVANFGIVCDVGDVDGIAKGWLSLVDDNNKYTQALVTHVKDNFSIEKMTRSFESTCASLTKGN